jgi:serine/threonine-protein kinase
MLQVGDLLEEKYRVVGLIGAGGMGAVYDAEHVVLHRHVAIKVLGAECVREAEAVKRFQREAQAAAQIGHDNICEVTDIGRTPDDQPYIVMPLLHGQPLSKAIAERAPLPIGRAVDITVQILEGLHAAHQAGIVHRDVKPDNVFLTRMANRDDFVKILDFGVSKVRPVAGKEGSAITQAGAVLGTPLYMSPEQALGEGPVDARTDVWAVGVILYEMLTKTIPFDGVNYNRILYNVMTATVAAPRAIRGDIPPELDAAVMTALERDVARRFQGCDAFRDAVLDAWLADGERKPRGVPTLRSSEFADTEKAPDGLLSTFLAPELQGHFDSLLAGAGAAPAGRGKASRARAARSIPGQVNTIEATPDAALLTASRASPRRAARRAVLPLLAAVVAAAALTGIVVLATSWSGTPEGRSPAAADRSGRTAATGTARAVVSTSDVPSVQMAGEAEREDAGSARAAVTVVPSAPAGGQPTTAPGAPDVDAASATDAEDSDGGTQPAEAGPYAQLPAVPADDEVRAAFERVRRKVQACLGGRAATMRCAAVVEGATGRAKRVDVSGDDAAVACVRAAVENVAFPRFGDAMLTFRHSYRFQGAARPQPQADAGGHRVLTGIDDYYPLPPEEQP